MSAFTLDQYLKQVFPCPAIRDEVLTVFSNWVNKRSGGLFNFYGQGNNSKSCFVELISQAFPGQVRRSHLGLGADDIQLVQQHFNIIIIDGGDMNDVTDGLSQYNQDKLIIVVSNTPLTIPNCQQIPFVSTWSKELENKKEHQADPQFADRVIPGLATEFLQLLTVV